MLNTPIPKAYAVHLEHAVWIYLLSLPYQLIKDINWWTIPAVTLASFALLGILGIGDEIENPFGYDYNDLVITVNFFIFQGYSQERFIISVFNSLLVVSCHSGV